MADKRTTPEAPEGAPQAGARGTAPQEARGSDHRPDGDRSAAGPAGNATAARASACRGRARARECRPGRDTADTNRRRVWRGRACRRRGWCCCRSPGPARALCCRPASDATGNVHDDNPQVAADNQAVDALTQRVGKIEETIKKLPTSDAGVTERLAAADSALKSLGVALTALNRRSDDIAANAS